MKFIKKFTPIFAIVTLFPLWLWFLYWAIFDKGNFALSIGAALTGTALLTPITVWGYIKNLRNASDLSKARRNMRVWAEVFAVTALFFGSSALIQIALSVEHQNVSTNVSRIGSAMSISSKVLEDSKCRKFPWTQDACEKIKKDLEQLFWGTMNDSLSERNAIQLSEAIEYKFNRLTDNQSTGFTKAGFLPIIDSLKSVAHDPVSATFNRMYLGLLTFLFAFLAGTRKIAIAWE